ncbi:Mediator Of Rna polymerase Ii Transcription Subunit 14 [Manis pentadactyla]|nr:Mediator Of Rna polymerase Ii Transcription Subunit 14 [Manis pentadactyla]
MPSARLRRSRPALGAPRGADAGPRPRGEGSKVTSATVLASCAGPGQWAGAGRVRGPGLGPGNLGEDRCQERGSRVRKFGQLKRGERNDDGGGCVCEQPFSDLIPSSPEGALLESLL